MSLECKSNAHIFSLPCLVEVRLYEPYTVAEVTFKRPSTMKEATSNGFRKVAGYIFGKNRVRGGRGSAKMAMTAPVRMSLSGDSGSSVSYPAEVKVSFVMGSNYTTKNLPQPEDGEVKLREVKPHYMAVVAFGGRPPTDATVEKKRRLVMSQLKSATVPRHIKSKETLVYGYHDPFITPALLRRNEVGVMLAHP